MQLAERIKRTPAVGYSKTGKHQRLNVHGDTIENLYKGDGFAVKELVINPHSSLSMQRHKHRSETWNLVSGKAHFLTSQ